MMIKNLNETLSLFTLIVVAILSVKYGLGLIFSAHLTGNRKDNFRLLKEYRDNIEE